MPLLQGSQGAIYFDSFEYAGVPIYYLLDIQPPDAPLPPPVQISVTPSRLAIGQTGTLKWTVNTAINASYPICFATGNVPGWTGRQPTSGSITGSISTAGVYSVALTCGGTESGTASVVVSKNIADTVTLSASPNPVVEGSTTTLKAVVQAQSGPQPTGPVSFYYGSDLLGTATLVNGTATLAASSIGVAPGNYSIVAKYGGDVNYALGASAGYTVSVTPAQ